MHLSGRSKEILPGRNACLRICRLITPRITWYYSEFEAGFSLMEDRKWEKAIIKFNRAIKLNPDHPQSYGNMGLCYAQMGRKQDALNAFNKALQIDPEYEPAILNRTFTERLEDGEPLSHDKFKSVDYYRDYPRGKKSFIQETVDAIQKEARFKNDKEEPS